MQGIHASEIAKQLGYGQDGGQFAQFDDNNPHFEDCEEEDDLIQERLWREDDERNGEVIVKATGDLAVQNVQILRQRADVSQNGLV